MPNSIDGTVNLALALQQHNMMEQKDASVLRKTLDSQAATVAQLVNSLPDIPELATSGAIGTQLHTTA